MKLTSIIIPAWNMLEYTKQCIDSVIQCTDIPYELILIDNGSQDGTWDYFKAVNGASVLHNEENVGSAPAANLGIPQSHGDYIMFLSNDTIVTPHWLNNMIRCLESSPLIGMVGPRTNHIAGPQMIQNVPYANIDEMWQFATEFYQSDPSKWWDVICLYGFCLLFKRDVVNRVGLLDEQFEFFVDDDFSRRIRNAGFQLWCAGDAFIHHYGSRTYLGNKVTMGMNLEEDRKKYLTKWGS